MQTYFLHAPAVQVLDFIEIFYAVYREQSDKQPLHLQSEINLAFSDFSCPWRICDGTFFKVDDGFLEHAVETANELLANHGFEGANDEFKKAREALLEGNYKEVIQKAYQSYESTLKTVLNKESGSGTDFLKEIQSNGYLDDLPPDKAKAVSKSALNALLILRNEMAGHGQGKNIVNIPQPYAELALHLAAACNIFLVNQKLRKHPPVVPKPIVPKAVMKESELDDELPF